MTAEVQPNLPGSRTRLRALVESSKFKNTILGVIIFNAVTLGMSTSDWVMATVGPVISAIDNVALSIFVIELILKLYVYGFRFFMSLWNLFDLSVVLLGLMPQGQGLSALRGLRVVRALRLLTAIPQMRKVVQALLDALPGMGAVVIMISIVFYIFGVMATLMYGEKFDVWFGTLGRSLYSLFQIMTLESWSMGIVRPVMEVYPSAWAFFVPFIVITSFSVLNLFIGLLVNTMQAAVEQEAAEDMEQLRDLVKAETDILDAHVRDLTQEIIMMREDLAKMRGKSDGE